MENSSIFTNSMYLFVLAALVILVPICQVGALSTQWDKNEKAPIAPLVEGIDDEVPISQDEQQPNDTTFIEPDLAEGGEVENNVTVAKAKKGKKSKKSKKKAPAKSKKTQLISERTQQVPARIPQVPANPMN